jgi:glycosyltransferase involved in cell wall biosynthesis
MKPIPSLSFFLPCYNEQNNIEPLVERLAALLPRFADEFEVSIVNDGSTDGTREKALGLAERFACVRVVDIPHGGYGAALNAGFATARHEWVAFTDADGQFAIDDFERLVPEAATHPCVIGYRETRAEGGLRRVNQFLLKVWAFSLFGIPWRIRDINCAFKLIRRDVLVPSLPLGASGGIVSTELLRALVRQGVSIAQVPVRHFPRQHGAATGANPRVILKAIGETASLLLR